MAGRKISQLTSSLAPSLSGETVVVLSGTTYKTSLDTLRTVLVDSGSHVFNGNQTIKGNLIVSGSLTAQQYIVSSSITNIVTQNISGSSSFGNDILDRHIFTGSVIVTGSLHSTIMTTKEYLFVSGFAVIGDAIHHGGDNPEALHVGTTNSYNIAHFKGDNDYYSQVYLQNQNSGSNSSTDLVVVADNGTENIHYIDLGINSSTYTGGLVGKENDAYLLNVGKDLYLGTVGGTEHPSKVHLFAENRWDNPQITIHTGSQVSFNTSSVSNGYTYEFSGSVKLQNQLNVSGSVTASYFVGDGSKLTNLPTSSVVNNVETGSFATTGSNTFIGDQIISGSLIVSGSQHISTELIQNLNGDLSLLTNGGDVEILGSNLNVPNGSIQTNYNLTAYGDVTIGGITNIKSVTEEILLNTDSNGDKDFDFKSGSIIYLSGLTSNGQYNVYNVPETNNKAITLTFVIEQGSTPYSGSGYLINGTEVNVKWVDNNIPTGSVNKTEVIGLTAFRINSSWNVIGALSTFG